MLASEVCRPHLSLLDGLDRLRFHLHRVSDNRGSSVRVRSHYTLHLSIHVHHRKYTLRHLQRRSSNISNTQDSYAIHAASALSFVTFTRYFAAGGFTIIAVPWFENLGVQYTLTILGCISAAMAPVPFGE